MKLPQRSMKVERNRIFGRWCAGFADYLKENLQVPYLFAPAHCNKQRAACVAVLGGILYRQGKAEDAAAHKPDYLRLSQAERERQEKARDFRI